jgi:hypothetical protein
MPKQMRLVAGGKGRGRTHAAPRKKPARRSRRRPTVLMIVALAALIAGFLFRRMMVPQAVHYLAYRPPDHAVGLPQQPAPLSDATGVAAAPSAASGGENLSDSDRRQLESVLRQKAK